jgi:hypothetical protein
MLVNSLCFKEASEAQKSGEIQLEEYLRHIVAHYGGLRHQEDAEGQRSYIPSFFETEVMDVVLSENIQPLDDDSKYILAAE